MKARIAIAAAACIEAFCLSALAGEGANVKKTFTLDFGSGSRDTNMDSVDLREVVPNAQDGNASLLFRAIGASAVAVKMLLPEAPLSAVLALTHLSSGADVPHGGESIIAVTVNGYAAVQKWDVGARGFCTDMISVTKYLNAGANSIEVMMVGGRTCYWLRKLEVVCEFSPSASLDMKVERIPPDGKSEYAVVVTRGAFEDPEWRKVVDALVKKRRAVVVVHPSAVESAREELAAVRPRFACFVGRPHEVGRKFVVAVHRMTRALDDDPYTDVLWGILTGFSASDAMRMVEEDKPLTVRRAAGGCGIDLDRFAEGVWYSEGEQSVMFEKPPGKPVEKKSCPPDTTEALVRELNENKPDVFFTSGHASERDWQIGYSYKNGQLRCAGGQLFGLDTTGKRFDVNSPNPKIYCPCGNCLMGHVDGPEAMAVAWMKTGGVRQMLGYAVSTWYGYMGHGVMPYFLRFGGRFTFAESFFLNNQALLERLNREYPGSLSKNIDRFHIETDRNLIPSLARELSARTRDEIGLLWDRDTVAFYGDPAWKARAQAAGTSDFDLALTHRAEPGGKIRFSFAVTSNVEAAFDRPYAAFLPVRIAGAQVTAGPAEAAVITDDFVMLYLKDPIGKGKEVKVEFTAREK